MYIRSTKTEAMRMTNGRGRGIKIIYKDNNIVYVNDIVIEMIYKNMTAKLKIYFFPFNTTFH